MDDRSLRLIGLWLQLAAWIVIACLIITGGGVLAWADQAVLTWQANTEPDVAGYKVYRSTTAGAYGAPVATLGPVTTYTMTIATPAVDQTYFFTITAYDHSGNESQKSNEVSKRILAILRPDQPVLTIVSSDSTSITVSYLPVLDGTGHPASVNVRYAPAPISWGSAKSATCTSSPCVIAGLKPDTAHDVQAVSVRAGTPNVFSLLSAILSARTAKDTAPPGQPHGLTVTKHTVDEVIVVAKSSDCRTIGVTQTPVSASDLQTVLNCIR